MIVVTGAAGFIAGDLIRALLRDGITDLLLVDRFPTDSYSTKYSNVLDFEHLEKMDRDAFPDWFTDHAEDVSFVFHLGARTDTSEFDFRVLDSLNLSYSKVLWEICTVNQIPMVYASSAATYGMGEYGFDDDEGLVPVLKPLNPYGLSKQLFDMHVLKQKEHPPFWAGLKFFNVYGPGESHKGRMASVMHHAFHQIKQTGTLKLFQSHDPNYKDGEQLRDFIYVGDVVDICLFFYRERPSDGIYNVGTGKANTFNELAASVFAAMDTPVSVEYIPIPTDIRDKYQYFTEAKIEKLRFAGYKTPFTSIQEGAGKYIGYLSEVS
ncbi:MAG: ADP-glyceromanno-heptose 6-epimerase precursor [Bacteroidetes bacterium]|nr:ADP-glyceromanno-heptose 6-epimerase precursor [Bacteroidota bacterium]